jgi:hypothetical protein
MILKRMLALVILLSPVLILAACSGSSATPQLPTIQPDLPTAVPSTTSAPTSAQGVTTSTSAPVSPFATTVTPPGATSESPIAPETNPLGDIPDTQVFISYTASLGNYSVEVPEGWARTINGSEVRFVDKFDGVSVTLKPASSAPTAASARQNEVAALAESQRAFTIGDVTDVQLPTGPAVRITANANSDPDPVTGKQVRVQEEIYIFYQNGTMAMLNLWAPQGADNVDQWKRMIESFRWK